MKKTLADMARSLGLMAVIIAIVVLVGARDLVFPRAADRMPAVDYSSAFQGFRDATHVLPLMPAAPPGSWRANAARVFSPAVGTRQLHVGWAVPGARFAGLDEAVGSADVADVAVLGARGRAVVGTALIAGSAWQVRAADDGERAYTRQVGRLFVVVTGTASDDQLKAFAASLH